MSHRIMVVEDHEDTREILRALLTHYGYEIIEAVSAEEMLGTIDAVKPDLVILDVKLPGKDGCEALDELRERGNNVPVFLFSEFYDLFRDRVKSCRPDAFFPKSKGPMEMIRAIAPRLAAKPSTA